MAAQFAVDLLFGLKGDGKLKEAARGLQGLDDASKKAEGSLNGLGNKFQATGNAAAGASNGIRLFGAGAKGAAGGVATLGAAVGAALGPISLVTAAVGGLTAAFKTIAAQDFAEAKVRTLGTNSADLVKELKKVSAELGGQASVVELTGAAYDVASAGFSKAADAAKILKAASLGATGGFSDINTVGNAATSVLNAYGLSADNAATLVDRFIQTQNDGKIVVAEYATNIGKVASAAAGLGIPLEEVNAVIAQATVSGVQAEVAFTGLKGAIARLASGEAAEALKGTGIQIDAASIKSDGLLGTLRKLEKLDTGQIFKALGTEAGPALLPVINNLEKFEELIKKQENSGGAAAAAQKEAANTIQGAWKSVQTEVENFFSNQSAAGQAVVVILQGVAGAIRALGAAFEVLSVPGKIVFDLLKSLNDAFDFTGSASRATQQFTDFSNAASASLQGLGGDLKEVGGTFLTELGAALEPVMQKWTEFQAFASGVFQSLAEGWSDMNQRSQQEWGQTAEWIKGVASGLWNAIASGASNIIAPIANAFKSAFNAAWNIIANFYNGLPAWIKGALSGAASVASGITSAVQKAVGGVGKALQAAGGKLQAGMQAKPVAAAGGGGLGNQPLQYQATGTGGGAPVSGGGGGKPKGGGGGKQERESQVPQLTAELALKQKLFGLETQIQAAQLAGDKVAVTALERKVVEAELDGKIAALQFEKIPSQEKGLKVELARLEAKGKLAELDSKTAKAEADRKKSLEEKLTGFEREIELGGLKTEEAKKLKQIEYDILDMKKEGLLVSDAEIAKYREKAIAASKVGGGKGKLEGYMDKLRTELGDTEGMIVSLAGTIEGEIGSAMSNAVMGLIQGTTTAEEAFGQMFSNIGKAFIEMATQMIAKALVMKVLGILGGGGGGGLGSFGGGGGFGSWGGGSFGSSSSIGLSPGFTPFAEGGYVTGPTNALIGEGGESEYVIPSSKMGAALSNYSAGRRGAGVLENNGGSGGAGGGAGGSGTINVAYTVERINERNYVTEQQFQDGMAQAAKRGAEGGHSKSMRTLQHSRSSRNRIGLG